MVKTVLVTVDPNKSEAIYFSTATHAQYRVVLIRLPFTNTHKHLGVTLSTDGKWQEHIKNITKSAAEILSTMRALKFQFNRKISSQIYISYMRPVLKYAWLYRE